MKPILSLIIVALLLLSASCREKEPVVIVMEDAVTDYDGNKYDAVQIGKQVWMKENLRTTHYADGRPVDTSFYKPHLGHENEVERYGYVYHAHAALEETTLENGDPSGIQGLCPDGWHLPSRYEWVILSRYVSQYESDVVGALTWEAARLADTSDLHEHTELNSFAFSAQPVQPCYSFMQDGTMSIFWTSNAVEETTNGSTYRVKYRVLLDYYRKTQMNFERIYYNSSGDASVRCVRD